MAHKRKLVIVVLVAAMALTGVLVGAVSADEGEEAAIAPQQQLMARIAARLGISQDALENAFREEAQQLMQERQNTRLERMVEEGVITEDQTNEFKAWWEARSDMGEAFGRMKGMHGGMIPRGPIAGGPFFGECPMPRAAE